MSSDQRTEERSGRYQESYHSFHDPVDALSMAIRELSMSEDLEVVRQVTVWEDESEEEEYFIKIPEGVYDAILG